MNGCCAFGDSCKFSHDKTDMPNQVCKYYLAGGCAYGDKCRYDHVKPSWSQSNEHSSSSYKPPVLKPAVQHDPTTQLVPTPSQTKTLVHWPSGVDEFGLVECQDEDNTAETSQPWHVECENAEGGADGYEQHQHEDDLPPTEVADPADLPLCSEYAGFGSCHRGDNCHLIHGDLCELCHKHAIHPYNPDTAQQHRQQCQEAQHKRRVRERDKQIECAICLERVLEQSEPSHRRFGLMTCDHAFCLHCIRSWRATGEVDVDTALRTCPICRVTSHFVTPSTRWPESPGDKQAIIDAYKAQLASTDCMHFDFGAGKCPFGTSCFYRHAFKDGTLETGPNLRKAGNAEGDICVIAPVSLASFLDTPQARRLLQGGRRRR